MRHAMTRTRGAWATAVMLGAVLVVLSVAGSGNLATAAKPQPPPSPRFVDNGDGTVTDIQTGLMWEQKTGTFDPFNPVDCTTPTSCADPTGVNNVYEWSSSGTAPDGALFTDFLRKMNCAVLQSGLGGRCGPGLHRDWRVPTIAELQTIVDCSFTPCINPIFGPTAGGLYWSSTSGAGSPETFAWLVNFGDGSPFALLKAGNFLFVRAVRGGA